MKNVLVLINYALEKCNNEFVQIRADTFSERKTYVCNRPAINMNVWYFSNWLDFVICTIKNPLLHLLLSVEPSKPFH